jgi:glycosyltransferase involved in cell wall biosynthesis
MRILHLISGLDTGGAELFLERLIGSLDEAEFQHCVVSLTGRGPVGERLRERGIRVHELHLGWGLHLISGLRELRRIIRANRPDLLQGWLYHGNLAASAGAWLTGHRCPVVWNIRHSLDEWPHEKPGLRGLVRLGGWLAGSPVRIVFNSTRSARQHQGLGYRAQKVRVIPNGFDLQKFAPDATLRRETRKQLDINDDKIVFGMIARYHPLKDHGNFLHAARIVADAIPHARFLLAGRQITDENPVLMGLIGDLQLGERVILLGERNDIVNILNACDVYVSSSSSEAFPNAIGEAMSCELPCVVTDAGDSADLVADAGAVVPTGAPELLARAMLEIAQSDLGQRRVLGVSARQRILQNYSNDDAAARYADLYRSVTRILANARY